MHPCGNDVKDGCLATGCQETMAKEGISFIGLIGLYDEDLDVGKPKN